MLEKLEPGPLRDLLRAEAWFALRDMGKAYDIASSLFFERYESLIDAPAVRRRLVGLLSLLISVKDPECARLMSLDRRASTDSSSDIVKAFYLGGANAGYTTAELVLRKKKRIEADVPAGRTIGKGQYFLEFLKKYSSYTPLLRYSPEESVGGGYFFCLDDYGLVIDPGHHFLDNFYKRGRCIDDIDGIAVTHFHDDHFADLPSLLALIYQSGKTERLGNSNFDLFLDEKTYASFEPLFRTLKRLGKKVQLVVGEKSTTVRTELKDGVFLEPLPAKHAAIESGDSVGLLITVNEKETQIFVTGDTGWNESIAKTYEEKTEYGRRILVAHVSTAYFPEIKGYLDGTPKYYKKHLCIRGLANLIESLRPTKVILSEIGEEFGPSIWDLAKLVKNRYKVPCIVGYDNTLIYID